MDDLLMWLSAGGDVGVWVIAAVMWKFDRRLILLETKFALSAKMWLNCPNYSDDVSKIIEK